MTTHSNLRNLLFASCIILVGFVVPSTDDCCRRGNVMGFPYVDIVGFCGLTRCAANERVFEASFGRFEDANRDGWPDVWKRRIDRDHPAFLKIGIATQSKVSDQEIQDLRRSMAQCYIAWKQKRLPGQVFAESIPEPVDYFLESTVVDPCIEVVMDGGAAELEGPLIPVNSKHAYRLSARLRSEFEDPFESFITLSWINELGEEISTMQTKSITGSSKWQVVVIDNLELLPPAARFARLKLNVKPTSRRSIFGKAYFDAISLDRVPRVDLQIAPSKRIFSSGSNVLIKCKLDAIAIEKSRVRIEIVDHNGQVVFSDISHASADASGTDASSLARHRENNIIEWRVTAGQPGFYRVLAEVNHGGPTKHRKSSTFVVTSESNLLQTRMPSNSKIGWALPTLGESLSIESVADLLSFHGVGNVKLSVWLVTSSGDSDRGIDWLTETLLAKGVGCVGVICPPPESSLDASGPGRNAAESKAMTGKYIGLHSTDLAIGELINKRESPLQLRRLDTIFENKKLLQTAFLPLWNRASLFLSEYQVGWDKDLSVSGSKSWRESLNLLSKQVRKFAPESQIALPWPAVYEPPQQISPDGQSWNRLMIAATPALRAYEMDNYLVHNRTHTSVGDWIGIDPLDAFQYSLSDRVLDCTQRMISLHKGAFETGWISDPTDPSIGIIDARGGPEAMMLPLRYLTRILNNADTFETIPAEKPDITQEVFRCGDKDCLIIWADRPQWIDAQWGPNWVAEDIWGREVQRRPSPSSSIKSSEIYLDGWPVLVRDIKREVLTWQTSVRIENPIIENRVGKSDPVRVAMKNSIPSSIGGKVQIIAPNLFVNRKADKPFLAEANAQTVVEVPIQLRRDASQSNEPIEIIVELATQPPTKFSVRRSLGLGLKNFQLECRSKIDARGRLLIEAEMTNSSGVPSTFDCTLIVPNQPRQRVQIINLKDKLTRTFLLPDATSIEGQTLLLRCEELSTGRVLNQRVAVPQP